MQQFLKHNKKMLIIFNVAMLTMDNQAHKSRCNQHNNKTWQLIFQLSINLVKIQSKSRIINPLHNKHLLLKVFNLSNNKLKLQSLLMLKKNQYQFSLNSSSLHLQIKDLLLMLKMMVARRNRLRLKLLIITLSIWISHKLKTRIKQFSQQEMFSPWAKHKLPNHHSLRCLMIRANLWFRAIHNT